LWGLADYPVIAPPPPVTGLKRKAIDSHLRSARFVRGYKVVAPDGVVGELADFLIDGRRWIIREVVVEFGAWYSRKAIRIPTERISRISYDESRVYVNLANEATAEVDEGDVAPMLGNSNTGT
jgi:hypothetical protein